VPQPGDFFVTATGGWVGRVIRLCTHSTVNHAGIYIGGGMTVEGQPKGAGVGCTSDYPNAIWSHMELTVIQRGRLVDAARKVEGTPYNFLDIAAQLLVRVFRWHAPKFVLNRLSRPDRLQCAQLVDWCYHLAGVELFPDGRPTGLVAPSDLLDQIGVA
jgi:hypothetical protein